MRSRPRLLALLAASVVVIAFAVVALTIAAPGGGSATAGTAATLRLKPAPAASAAATGRTGASVASPAALSPSSLPTGVYLGAQVLERVAVRAGPGGRPLAQLGRRTQFGSPQTVWVVRRRGSWVGVVTSAIPNNHVGWLPVNSVRLYEVSYALHALLGARELELLREGRVIDRIRIAVGRPGSTTPLGRFAVTDRLLIAPGSPYGCCALALSAHQPNVPQGWSGGDRIAIHATADLGSIGQAASAGCMRATDADLRRLLRLVPLGAPVFVSA